MVPQTQEQRLAAVPQPVTVTGGNPLNGALLSAQRKVNMIYDAAMRSDDPVGAMMTISTSRTNGYTTAADNNKIAMLRHFGYQPDGNPVPGYSAEATGSMPAAPVLAPETARTAYTRPSTPRPRRQPTPTPTVTLPCRTERTTQARRCCCDELGRNDGHQQR